MAGSLSQTSKSLVQKDMGSGMSRHTGNPVSQDWIWATAAQEAGREPRGKYAGIRMSVQKILKGQNDSKMSLKTFNCLSTGK